MYLFITWLLINLFHPLVLSIAIGSEKGIHFSPDVFKLYMPLLLTSLLFSSISLLTSYGVLHLIKRTIKGKEVSFIVWFFAALLTTLLNFWLVFIFFDDTIALKDLKIAIPGCVCTAVVILCRYRYFLKMLNAPSNQTDLP